MSRPLDTSLPRLATGCRWSGEGESRMLLFPEGALRVRDTGHAILQRCDGQHTFQQIVEQLQALYQADAAKIREDVAGFLDRLQQKRVVDF